MSGIVVGAVLLSALLHASWNALVKAGGDRWLTPALIAGFSALFAVIVIPFLPLPQLLAFVGHNCIQDHGSMAPIIAKGDHRLKAGLRSARINALGCQ